MGLRARLVAVACALCALSPKPHTAHALAATAATGNRRQLVLGVDLGAKNLRVAAAAGTDLPSIVLNSLGERKTPAVVWFGGAGERLVAEHAHAQVVASPEGAVVGVRERLGVWVGEEEGGEGLPRVLRHSDRGTALFELPGRDRSFSAEEVTGMLLQHAVDMADDSVHGIVVSVPAFFSHPQRRALAQSAEVGGVPLLSIVNDHAAVALAYSALQANALDLSPKTSKHVLFYSMGASTTQVSLVLYSLARGRVVGRQAMLVPHVRVKGAHWDASLGSNAFTQRLQTHLVSKLHEQLCGATAEQCLDGSVLTPRAIARIHSAAQRAMEVLSANSEAHVNLESLADGVDLHTTVARVEFEAMCADLWERAIAPLTHLLSVLKVKVDRIASLELVGGMSRVPRLQTELTAAFGGRAPSHRLDKDDATVIGATLRAVNITEQQRLKEGAKRSAGGGGSELVGRWNGAMLTDVVMRDVLISAGDQEKRVFKRCE